MLTSARVKRKSEPRSFSFGNATLIQDDCLTWLERQPTNSVHAVVTDPPYGLVEYSEIEQRKLRAGRGGIWRIPPSLSRRISMRLNSFSPLGRRVFCRCLCPAQTLLSQAILFSPTSCRMPCPDPVSSAGARSSDW